MRILLFAIVAFAVAVCVYFAYLSKTEATPDAKLIEGQLRPCPDTPNCVSSETSGDRFIEPLKPATDQSLNSFWENVIKSVQALGGEIQRNEDGYLWATFQSAIFKFTDDLELRLDNDSGVIQVRSGSRSGESDLGVNRKRVEALRQQSAQ